jgi:hypothetical protein
MPVLLAIAERLLVAAVGQTVSILDSNDFYDLARVFYLGRVTSLKPMWRILPCSCIRLSAPSDSSSGVRGSMRCSW